MSLEPTDPAGLLQAALSCCDADHVEAAYREAREASTRFANNAITQNVSKRTATLTVKAVYGSRIGRAATSDFSAEGLRDCGARAAAAARAAAPDPEFLPPPGPQRYAAVDGYDERVASTTPEERAARVREATEIAREAGQQAAGSYATASYLSATANSAGLYHQQRLTNTQFVMTAMTEDSSGWAQSSGHGAAHVDARAAAETAVRKAAAARQPRDLPAGEYALVLEPAAVSNFFGFLGFTMDAKAAHEGRTAFTGREGERVAVPGITLSTRADHPRVPCLSASEDGLPLPETTWIEDGILRTLSYGRYWAEKSGRPFTGKPANLVMEGGDRSLEELIAGVERGVLVTRFWYIRFVDPMKLLLTGMTRDGLFWIEDGRIAHGLRNMRFNESPLRCLERVSALGPQVRTADRYLPTCMPAMRVEGFRFTSGTSF